MFISILCLANMFVLDGLQMFSVFEFSEYLDEAMLIPKNTSVLIRRVPGRPRITVITAQE